MKYQILGMEKREAVKGLRIQLPHSNLALKTYASAAVTVTVTVTVTVPWRRLAAHGRVRVNLKPRRRGVVVVECSYQPIC